MSDHSVLRNAELTDPISKLRRPFCQKNWVGPFHFVTLFSSVMVGHYQFVWGGGWSHHFVTTEWPTQPSLGNSNGDLFDVMLCLCFMFYFVVSPLCWNVVAQFTLPCGDLMAKAKKVNAWHVCCLWHFVFRILQYTSPESSITMCLCMNLVLLSLLKQHRRWCLPETIQATSMTYVHVDIAKYGNTWAIQDCFKML